MGAAASVHKDALPQEFVGVMQSVDFDALCKTANLNKLKKLDFVLSSLRQKVQNAMTHELVQLGHMPEAPIAILEGKYKNLSSHHKSLIQDTTAYLVTIAPDVHLNKALKHNLRRLLGLNFEFTSNLPWAGSYGTLMDGCKAHLNSIGKTLNQLFIANDYRSVLGSYEPKLNKNVDQRQFVPEACAPSRFGGNATLVADRNLELIYIHFLRLLALSLDGAFQDAVRNRLKSAGIVGFTLSSGGIKGYERMVNKMLSAEDHLNDPKPRPASNIDVVRCLVSFASAEDLLRGSKILDDIYQGGYVKFKNGMAWDDEMAASRFHLRLLMGTGWFQNKKRPLMKFLRHDPATQLIWTNYINTEEVPLSMSRDTWRCHVEEAQRWIQDVADDTPIQMLCEVQMVVKEYGHARTAMHELYKIVRASSAVDLHKDFARYEREFREQQNFESDGSTPFKAACRDGDDYFLLPLLDGLDAKDLQEGLKIACEHVRPTSVKLLIDTQNPNTDLLSEALRITVTCNDGRKGFKTADSEREQIVRLLIAAKADVNAATGNGRVPLHGAASNGYSSIAALLIGASAEVNVKDSISYTPCCMAAEKNEVETLKVLINAKADTNIGCGNGWRPIVAAGFSGWLDTAQLLVECKTDLDLPNGVGATATAMSAEKGHPAVLRVLLQAKSNVNKPTQDGYTPLFMASQFGHPINVKMLLEFKAEVDKPAQNQVRPLYIAANRNQVDIMKILLEFKADPNGKNGNWGTALQAATKLENEEIADLLKAAGATP